MLVNQQNIHPEKNEEMMYSVHDAIQEIAEVPPIKH
jgi:hypothetical protein